MSAKAVKDTSNRPGAARREIPKPVDVVDGIPDRSGRPSWWKYVLLGVLFAAWVLLLLYVALGGNP